MNEQETFEAVYNLTENLDILETTIKSAYQPGAFPISAKKLERDARELQANTDDADVWMLAVKVARCAKQAAQLNDPYLSTREKRKKASKLRADVTAADAAGMRYITRLTTDLQAGDA
ncbi:hypothetical protein HUG15_00375 [Salicibibacter cibarius]|uniref:Uncharacterized protein n=2 Tax=Salicibibacter cibarius TaxID=2743000 RepID=A0A7T7CA10_9BACI|nr:hypothetical protein HUG15_00375 [Salicibibacter cibarius]